MKRIDFREAKVSYKLNFVYDKLQKGEVGILAGLGASGKSLFMLDNVLSYFINKLGLIDSNSIVKMEFEKILFITTEDTKTAVLNRINRFLKLHFNDLDSLALEPMFDYLNENFILEIANSQRDAKEIIEKYNDYDFLVLDTFSVIAEVYNENDNSEIAKKIQFFKDLAREKDISVLFIHHLSQAGFKIENEKDISGDLIRGATALINNSRYASILAMGVKELYYKNVKANSGKMETIKMEKEFWNNGFQKKENDNGNKY